MANVAYHSFTPAGMMITKQGGLHTCTVSFVFFLSEPSPVPSCFPHFLCGGVDLFTDLFLFFFPLFVLISHNPPPPIFFALFSSITPLWCCGESLRHTPHRPYSWGLASPPGAADFRPASLKRLATPVRRLFFGVACQRMTHRTMHFLQPLAMAVAWGGYYGGGFRDQG